MTYHSISDNTMNHNSILIIGATGRTGNSLVEQIASRKQNSANNHRQSISVAPKIYAMCRDPLGLDKTIKAMCAGVVRGNARSTKDIENALNVSKADLVMVAVGNGDSVKKTDIRTASARALVSVLTSSRRYNKVRVIVVSSIGAGTSQIKYGYGVGKFIKFHLRHILRDHDGQEEAFLAAMKDRTFIVRPTALTEDKAAGKVVIFNDNDKCPNLETDRADLAHWLANELVYHPDGATNYLYGQQINIAGMKH